MKRDEALMLLTELTVGDSLLRHGRAVEIVMRQMAVARSEDEELWGNAGLLHDADYEKWPDEHPNVIVAKLRELGEEVLAHAISAHYTKWNVPYDTDLSKALVAADELTGFIVACCYVRPDGVHSLKPKSVLKRFKDKRFAAKVDREEITLGCALIEVEIADQVGTVIEALIPHADELGIGGKGA